MLQTLIELDQQLFLLLNGLHAPWWDAFMAFVTAKAPWIPLYALITGYLFYLFHWKGIIPVAALASGVVLADRFASGFCKPFFARPRPCYEPELEGLVHVVTGCGGQYGFISSHAATTFALAAGLFYLLRNRHAWIWVMFLWSSLVTYSRIAVGVHYPGDLLFGAAAGFFFGWLCFLVMNKLTRGKYSVAKS
jgi:undecaprenyl-diphosphatase